MEFAPIASTTKSDVQVQTQPTSASRKNLVNRLKNTLTLAKQDSSQELNLVPSTPASIVQSDRKITRDKWCISSSIWVGIAHLTL
jgi:hypothetical protein